MPGGRVIFVISIHSPSEGRDIKLRTILAKQINFNPLSQRRERRYWLRFLPEDNHFNPLSQRRERPLRLLNHFRTFFISIHSPSEGRDHPHYPLKAHQSLFQSTLPAKGETRDKWLPVGWEFISIHSPSEGGDGMAFARALFWKDFNPLSQRRERLH